VIENFIDEDECAAVEEVASRTLKRAMVSDGQGGTKLSYHRRAMQAGIEVNWNATTRGSGNRDANENDYLIARVSRRVYNYVNHVLGLNITEKGQEPLMSIQV